MGVSYASAETLVTPAKIVEVTERGYVLQIGTEPLVVEDSVQTRFWHARATTKRDSFKAGDSVVVRLNTATDPPEVRELIDSETAKWLDAVRKTPQSATITKLDTKYLEVKLADGSNFRYRVTDKTIIQMAGKPENLMALSAGKTIYVKARMLPTLDTWASEISDKPFAVVASKAKSTPKPKRPPALAASGILEGNVVAPNHRLNMFSVMVQVRALHITYTSATKFTLNGQPCRADQVNRGLRFKLTYRRDKFGRIFAQKVELFG
jgi:hypothetical protein